MPEARDSRSFGSSWWPPWTQPPAEEEVAELGGESASQDADGDEDPDLEAGEEAPIQWAARFAKKMRKKTARTAKAARKMSVKAAKVAAQQVEEAREIASGKVEEAKANVVANTEQLSGQFSEHIKGLQEGVTRSFGTAAEKAEQAKAVLQEKGKLASQSTKEFQEKAQQKLSSATEQGAKKAREAAKKGASVAGKGAKKARAAREKAASVAGKAKDRMKSAGSSLGSKFQGMASGLKNLTISPAKLAKFGGLFLLGIIIISMSFSFLPMLPVAPQKFALLFAFGSMTLLSSLAVLKGPKSFAKSLVEPTKLPFSGAYIVSLLGTFGSTIFMKNYILTAVFGVVQALSLLYFLASYVPGGQALLSFCGRCCSRGCGRCARTVSG